MIGDSYVLRLSRTTADVDSHTHTHIYKTVHLTKAKAKGSEGKAKVIESLRDGIDSYELLTVFDFENMRTNYFKELRQKWQDSRFFLGKNKVMQVALGKNKDDELRPNLSKVASHLKGQCGVLLTNKTLVQVKKSFEGFRKQSYARAGATATQTIQLEEGVIHGQEASKVEYFKKLGMPVRVKNAQLYLMERFTVCTDGKELSPEQCAILKQMGLQMSEFRIRLRCYWKKDGSFGSFEEDQ